MNISVKNIFFAVGATAILASCSENSWNDKLDGFEPGVNYDKAIEGTISMTSADYKAVAENEINIELAGADTLLLKAVGKNGYFTSEIPAIEYLPAFLASTSSPYCFAPVGSKVNITYQEADSVNPVIAEMARAAHYKVSAADYQSAWKSNEDFIEAFAPMTSASAKLPAILKEGIKDATAGQYAIVNYEEAETNPVFISGAAMTEIYAESFETGIGLFSIDNVNLPDSLKYVWYHDAKNKYMKASAFKAPNNYESESWLISPDITLGGTKANFSFSEATNYFSNIETAKKEASVWVRVVGASWEQITDYDFPTSMSWTWVDSGEIDLSMYCGKTIQIGFKFTSTAAKSGTWEVKNFVVNAEEGSVAAADSKSMKKVLASTPAITSKVAVYKYDGNAWEAASDIMVIQPAQYTAMGYNNNALGDLPITLPLYMKVNAPYAVAGDSKTVVYNDGLCSVLTYDGQSWAINNNNKQTIAAQFVKKDSGWAFEKYLNTDSYVLATELVLDTKYLIVAEDICATALAASKTYGYLNPANVEITDDIIEQNGDANAFTFASSATIGGGEYTLGEDEFLIIDSRKRYLYMTGTYNSFNVSESPNIIDGAINPEYIFTAKQLLDGTWKITNKAMEKYFQFSKKHNSWGAYQTEQAEAVMPTLYVITE